MGPHAPLDDSLGGLAQARLLAARMRLGGHSAGGTVLAQHCLHEGETHPEYVGHGALGAEVPLPSPQNRLTYIDRIGSHVTKAKVLSSYVQGKSALARAHHFTSCAAARDK